MTNAASEPLTVSFRPTYNAYSLLLLLIGLGDSQPVLAAVADPLPCAVVIGVSDYQDEKITDLAFANRDAEAFAEFLRSPAGGFPARRVRVLTDTAATLAAIQAALAWQLTSAQEGALAVLYFAGHGDVETREGDRQGYLLAHDTPKNNYSLLALGVDYLNRHIAQLSEKGGRMVVITDACRSGTLAGNSVDGRRATTAQLSRSLNNEVKILSCQPNELAQEDRRWGGGRGAFSYYLIEGLRGAADRDQNLAVDLFELESYLQREVRQTTDRTQHPEISGGRRDEPFFRVGADAASTFRAAELHLREEDFERAVLEAAPAASQATYVRFGRALSRGRLLEPADKSAQHYYRVIRADTAFTSLHGILRERLTVALLDAVQQAIRAYLDTDANELMQRERLDDKYRSFPAYLEVAAELLGEQDPRYKETLAKRDYFRGLVLRLEADHNGGNDTMYHQALALQKAAVARAPTAAYLHNELGMLLRRTGNPPAAFEAFNAAIQLAPTWALPPNNIASLARRLDPEGNFPYAEFYFKRAIELKPEFSTAYMNYGNALLAVGKPDEAIAHMRRAVELGPGYVDAYYNLAIALYPRKDDRAEAIRLFREVLRRKPDYHDAYGGLGHAFEKEGDIDSALVAYRGAVQLQPDYDFGLGRLRELYVMLGQADTARYLLDQSIERAPSAQPPYFHRALVDTTDFTWLDRLRNAPLDRSRRSVLAQELGYDFFLNNHPTLAERAFLLSTELRTDLPTLHNNLARFYARTGRTRDALKRIRTVLKMSDLTKRVAYCTEYATHERYAALRPLPAFRKLLRKYCPPDSPE